MDIKRLVYNLILLFFITSLLFPTLIFNKLFFAASLFLMIAQTNSSSKIYTMAPFVVCFIFLFGYIVSFFNVVNRELSNQFLLSVSVLFLIFPIIKYKINLDAIVKISAFVMVVSTLIYFIGIVALPGNPLSGKLLNVFDSYSAGAYGFRDFTEEATLSFHIGTVPFLYLPFCLYFISFLQEKKISKIFVMLLILTTIVASAARGLLFTSLLALGMIYFFNLKLSTRIGFLAIMVPVAIIGFSYLLTNTNIFSSEEESNGTKIGHLISFFDNLDWINFFIGNGLASYYYSSGSHAMKAHTEITPVDMLRYFGFVLTPLLYSVIIFPTKKLTAYLGKNKFATIIFILYLINTFTNPIMFNSYGLLTVLWYWSKILVDYDNDNQVFSQTQLIAS